MYSITNTTRGPRFVYTMGEPRLVEAGQTVEFDLTDSEARNVQQQVDAGVLAWEGEAPNLKAEPAADMTAAELLAQADGMHVKTLQSAASKILGDATPSTKAEIIAALEAKAQA